MDKFQLEEDPIAFAKAAAEQLVPLGVRYLEFGGMKLAFESPIAAAVAAAATAVGASGLSTKDEDELDRLMQADSTSDPINDPTTFPGGQMVSYRAARRPPAARRGEEG